MPFSVRIVIVEDEVMIRSMLRLFCESEPAWHVVGEAGDCENACSIVEAMCPDIVLLDLALGNENGIDCLPHLLRLGATRVVVLTGNEDPAAHVEALARGASTVLRKGDPPERIKSTIRHQASSIMAERTFLASPSLKALQQSASQINSTDGEKSLTDRERHIIQLLAAGCKDEDIANDLALSHSTVHHALSTIYHKLGVADRVELVVYAFQNQLAEPK